MENQTNQASGNKRTPWIIGVAVVAIAVIGYFTFFYPPVEQKDVSGSIGGAKKYRSEQITDKDVKLEGQSSEKNAAFDNATLEQKSAMFEKATDRQKFDLVSTASDELQQRIFAGVSAEDKAKFVGNATLQLMHDMAERAPKGAMVMLLEKTLDAREVLAKVPDELKAKVYDEASADLKKVFWQKADAEGKSTTWQERMANMQQASVSERAGTFSQASRNLQLKMLSAAPIALKEEIAGKMLGDLIARATSSAKADFFVKLPIDMKVECLKQAPSELLNKFFARIPAEDRAAVLKNASFQEKDALVQKADLRKSIQ
jgi:Mg/Co/Ni transporter MgtE